MNFTNELKRLECQTSTPTPTRPKPIASRRERRAKLRQLTKAQKKNG